MAKLLFSGIRWDTEGEPIGNLNLPENIVMEVDDKNKIDPDDYDITDLLSDEYGFCVDGIDEVRWMEDDEEIDYH